MPVAFLAALAAMFVCLPAAVATNGAASVNHFFTITCRFSHAAPDDPIVYPGKPGRSHEHAFLGNVSTNASTTPASLPSHRTTCNHAGDDSAYWAPALYAGGKPVAPTDATIYYSRLTSAPVKPFPAGLEMIAGNSHAVTPQSPSVTNWECNQQKANQYSMRAVATEPMGPAALTKQLGALRGFPRRGPATNLELVVNFPNCSDGMSNSTDHKSHMAYSVGGTCPASHPISVPAISLVLRYPTLHSTDVFLASGGLDSGHADFMNGWKASALAKVVDDCLNLSRVCGYPAEPGALN